MKTESKISFPLYKICYSLAFVAVLSLVRGVSSVAEIGNVMQQAMGILAVVFCADTYMQEVQSSRAEVFGLYSMRKKLRVVYTRLAVQTAYLYMVSILGYGCFFWQRPVSSWDGDPAWVSFLMYLAAMPAMLLFCGTLSMTVANLLKNLWAGIGLGALVWFGLISSGADELFGKWNVFSFAFRDIQRTLDVSWLCGTGCSLLLAAAMLAAEPAILGRQQTGKKKKSRNMRKSVSGEEDNYEY